MKRYGELTPRQAVTTRLEDIQRDVALAEEHGVTTANLAQLKDWAAGPLDVAQFDRQLEILRFDLEIDPLVVGHFGSSNRKFRKEAGQEIESSFFFDLSCSFGFVVGVSNPVPPQWRPEWHVWDDASQTSYGQTYGASNTHIREHRFLFTEGDGGLPPEEQIATVTAAGLPTPTLIVDTGGKSLHFYWVLLEPVTPERFRLLQTAIQKALIRFKAFEVDTSLKNPSRIMRAVGSLHPKTGRRCVIHTSNPDLRYDVEAIAAMLPDVTAVEVAGPPREADTWDAKDALELLEHIPNDVTDARLLELELISYDLWLGVGMSLHWAGCDVSDWIRWSATNPKHDDGACEAKWASFDSDGAKTISFLRWLAKELSGFELKFDPSSLTSPWIVRGRERTRKLGEEIKAAKEAEAARIAALPEWERDWSWLLKATITLERHVEKAFEKKATVEESPVVFVQNRFRRYDPEAGYFRHLPIPNVKAEIAAMLKKVFVPTNQGKDKAFNFTSDQKTKGCEKWLAINLFEDDCDFVPSRQAIAFNNGTAYWQDGRWQFGEHSADNRLTHRIDADFVPGAECPEVFKEFVRTSYGLKYLEIIRALVAYTADPRYRCQIILFLLGQTGSGKGALLQVLASLVPAESRTSLSRCEEINSADKMCQLVMGKQMLVWPDVQGKQSGISNLYKLVDPNERLTARALYSSESVNFEFRGRVMCASTSSIQLDHAGSGLMRRLLTLETFEHPLPSDILPQDKANSGALENLMISKLGEIVGWALAMPEEEVQLVLQKRDPEGLLSGSAMKVAANADSANLFIDCCLEPADASVKPEITEMYCCYQLFCTTQGMRPLALKNFKQRLSESLRHLYLPRRSEPGSWGKAKLPATFFGFQMIEGLWQERVEFRAACAHNMIEAPTHQNSLGVMDTRKLSEGGFETLASHRPS